MPTLYRPDGKPIQVTDRGVGIWTAQGYTHQPPSTPKTTTGTNAPGMSASTAASGAKTTAPGSTPPWQMIGKGIAGLSSSVSAGLSKLGGTPPTTPGSIPSWHNTQPTGIVAGKNIGSGGIPGNGYVAAQPGIQPGTPASHQDYIEKTRPGGMANYEAIQRDRYQKALASNDTDLLNRLNADSVKRGYSLQQPEIADKAMDNPGMIGDPALAGDPNSPWGTVGDPATTEPTLPDYSWIEDMVNNELASQKTAIEQELARLKQSSELAVNQNNTFLQDQIKKLEENRVTVGNEIANYQNRRGGWYSGGVDFQQAHNNEAFTEVKGAATRDIGARNADIWGRNALLAEQAAENLAKLESQAPDRIRQLIEEQKAKDAAFALQEAGVTQVYKGQVTPAGQAQILNNQGQALTNQISALKLQNLPQEIKLGLQQLENDVATGLLNRQEAELKLNELKDPNSITNKAARLDLQIKELDAKYLPQEQQLKLSELRKRIAQIGAKPAVSAQEAEMKTINLEKARIELEKLKNGDGKKVPYKENPNWSAEIAELNSDPEGQYKDYLAHPQDYISTYTYDGYEELKKQAKALIDNTPIESNGG